MTELYAENVETKYVCVQCGAEDLDRGVAPPAPMALNCHACHAGSGMETGQMFAKKIGMFPIVEEEGEDDGD